MQLNRELPVARVPPLRFKYECPDIVMLLTVAPEKFSVSRAALLVPLVAGVTVVVIVPEKLTVSPPVGKELLLYVAMDQAFARLAAFRLPEPD